MTKGAEKTEGLFTLYRKDEELKQQDLDKPLLLPIAIATYRTRQPRRRLWVAGRTIVT